MTIEARELALIEDFEWIEDAMDRYEHIIDLGKKLAPLDERYKVEQYVVKGCQSTVWLFAEKKEDKIYYYADSNTQITKGIVAILVHVFSGATAEEIIENDMSIITKIQLREHLTSQRSNGLSAMIKQMKQYAVELK